MTIICCHHDYIFEKRFIFQAQPCSPPKPDPKNHSENSALAFIEKRKKHADVQSIIML